MLESCGVFCRYLVVLVVQASGLSLMKNARRKRGLFVFCLYLMLLLCWRMPFMIVIDLNWAHSYPCFSYGIPAYSFVVDPSFVGLYKHFKVSKNIHDFL